MAVALAGLLFAVPVVIAFTVHPAVARSPRDRLLVTARSRTIHAALGLSPRGAPEPPAGCSPGGPPTRLWAIPGLAAPAQAVPPGMGRGSLRGPLQHCVAHVRGEQVRRGPPGPPSGSHPGDLRGMAAGSRLPSRGAQGAASGGAMGVQGVIAPTLAGAVPGGVSMLAVLAESQAS